MTRWTETDDETLKRRWAAGDSTRDIAEELGCTRSAVIGRAYRLGLARHGARPAR